MASSQFLGSANAVAAGLTGQIQVNNNGVLAGSSALAVDGTTLEVASVLFPEDGGLAFTTDGGTAPITVTGGDDGFGEPALNISNSADGVLLNFPDTTTLQFFKQPVIFSSVDENLVTHAGFALGSDSQGFDLTSMYGYWTQYIASGNSVLTNLSALYMVPELRDTAAVTNVYGAYFVPQAIPGGATVTNSYAFYSNDLTTFGTNPYFLWYTGTGTGAGVFRVNGLGILAYYNPAFTTYTPGATNYERIVLQWNANVAEIGVEASGTGTLRAVKVIGASLQAASYKSNDGTAGATAGPFTVITGITVKNGLVTALTGS